MDKEQLKQNVRKRAHVLEDGGLRLLKKSKHGLFRVIFSRAGIMTLLLLLQVLVLFGLFDRFNQFLLHYIGGITVLEGVMAVYLLNSTLDNSAKLTWLFVIALAPVFGIPMFWYTKSNFGYRIMQRRLLELESETSTWIAQNPEALAHLEAEDPGAASLARYLNGRVGGFPVYENTAAAYFPSGEAAFAALLEQLETAREYIFVEYFIISEGMMWGRILEVLARKAAEGVEVRVIYDGMCEFSTLTSDYSQRLEALGIRCKVFSPVQPLVSTHYNYRDHRKILVIDGRVGFTGGVNLADEYINHIQRFGRWKDAAVMLEGEGVRSLTALFLQQWSIRGDPEFDAFLYRRLPALPETQGFVAPYGDCPLDTDRVGEMVYIDLLNRARRYVHIMTPYLILDGEMETALKFAAERGVDVHLILPGVPDKRIPYALAKTHYASLLSAGVKISEWEPGFVHAKVFVADDREAVVGTINLDYRSFYHHFEDAVWMHGTACIPAIEADFQAALAECRSVEPTAQSIWREHWLLRIAGVLVKFIAPLL